MSGRVFLIGGGWDRGAAELVHGPFLRAAGDAPRIGCVVVDEGDGEEQFTRYEGVLTAVGAGAVVPLLVPPHERFDPEVLRGVDGLLVCGGLTPAYQEAFAGCRERLARLLAERGMPYAGFSAGAAVAARHAVGGGWLSDDGVAVCPEDAAEDLEGIEVRDGLGLVPFAVDVHAAQWGTLGRMAEAVARGLVPWGVAVDENTVVEVATDGTRARVGGLGRAHVVRPDGGGGVVVRPDATAGVDVRPDAAAGVVVRSYPAGSSFSVPGADGSGASLG